LGEIKHRVRVSDIEGKKFFSDELFYFSLGFKMQQIIDFLTS